MTAPEMFGGDRDGPRDEGEGGGGGGGRGVTAPERQSVSRGLWLTQPFTFYCEVHGTHFETQMTSTFSPTSLLAKRFNLGDFHPVLMKKAKRCALLWGPNGQVST